jgi:hypothetical protein
MVHVKRTPATRDSTVEIAQSGVPTAMMAVARSIKTLSFGPDSEHHQAIRLFTSGLLQTRGQRLLAAKAV